MTGEAGGPKKSAATVVATILACLVGGCLFLGFVTLLLLPIGHETAERARVTSCANNLAQLWKMQQIYESMYQSKDRLMPIQTGAEFWLHLKRTPRPLIDPSNEDIYLCPVLGSGTVGEDIHYYGPGKRVDLLGAAEPVGSDDMKGDLNGEGIPNHGGDGGNLIRKTGDVLEVSEAEWNDLSNELGGGDPITKPIP